MPVGVTATENALGATFGTMSEVVMDFSSRKTTMAGGEWRITGNVTITEHFAVSGNVLASGVITDELGNTFHQVH